MDNEVLNDISNYAKDKLTEAYGYCGLASGFDIAVLNSEDIAGRDIAITIKVVD